MQTIKIRPRDIVALMIVVISLITMCVCVNTVQKLRANGDFLYGKSEDSNESPFITLPKEDVGDESYSDSKLFFKINQTELKLGIKCSKLLGTLHLINGAEDTAYKTIGPKSTKNFDLFDNNGNKFIVGVYNDSDVERTFDNCLIKSIDIQVESAPTASVSLFQGLSVKSSVSDFVDVYGDWSNKTTSGNKSTYSWTTGGGEIYLITDSATKSIISIKLIASVLAN